jgi:thiosulfate dehydrogenase
MLAHKRLGWALLAAIIGMGFAASCVVGLTENDDDPVEFAEADDIRGGALYDKWWAVIGADEPTTDHAFWADRPDQTTNERTGKDTWRCKECHGWDYQGIDGAYSGGSHKTGFAGIAGTDLQPQDLFDELKTDHGYGDAGMSDDDVWDVTRFVLKAQVDTDAFISSGLFTGDAEMGQADYDNVCKTCHGDDGLTLPPGADTDFDAFVGVIANDNPWEFLHKVRFGQPDTDMPPQADLLSEDELNDLGAYAQTLPTAP